MTTPEIEPRPAILPTGMWFCAFHFAYPPLLREPAKDADCGNTWYEGEDTHACEWRQLYFHRASTKEAGS